ncbi:cytoskeleton-associated protein 2-like [Cololabis saira]|uniref:cytoskeleton-associated protein 2-like n=1 Tax=Cololabis saira TaxID=129043 RepID=UPI002AD2DC45|nr:cytoskeleton-associated protein 2-like [Cololabis saira]
MEEEVSAPILSRRELRKQKLMEYLTAKGKMKPPSAKSYPGDDCKDQKPVTVFQQAVGGKENKSPADGVKSVKIQRFTLTAQSSRNPPRRAFGFTGKINMKSSTEAGEKNAIRPPLSSAPARPKPNHNPVLTRTYTVTSSKSSLTAASCLKKQPNTHIQTSGKALINATHKVGEKFNSKSSLNFNSAKLCPVKTASTRLSVGPFVQTKTGLIPAVTQPRTTRSDLRQPSASAARGSQATTAGARKTLPKSTTSVFVSQRSAAAAAGSSTRRAEEKVQVQSKSQSQPFAVRRAQPTCKGQPSSGLRPTSSSFKCRAEPQGRAFTNPSSCQFENRSTKARSGAEGNKNGQACKVAPPTSFSRANRVDARVVPGVRPPGSTQQGGRTKTSKEMHSKKENTSTNVPKRKTGSAMMCQTAPQPSRTVSFTGRATDRTTANIRAVPQTEGKKLTAAQEARLKKLQEWREAKGISYKRPPMPVKAPVRRTLSLPQPFWASMKAEDDAHSLICAVDRSLADCIKLLAEGCPADQVKEVLSRLPAVAQKFAKYWICRARLMEREGNLDVLPMFEEAVRVVLEPVDELRTVVFDIMKKKDGAQVSGKDEREADQIPAAEQTEECSDSPMMTPKPVRALISGEQGASSVVKYKITATPGGPPSQQRDPVKVNGQEVRFFTPVRRSVRIERTSLRYPSALQDHDVCVASYRDLISQEDAEKTEEQENDDEAPMYVYRENEALRDKVSVDLVCDDQA